MKKTIKSIIKEEIRRGLKESSPSAKVIDIVVNVHGDEFENGDTAHGHVVDSYGGHEEQSLIQLTSDNNSYKNGTFDIPGVPDYGLINLTVLDAKPAKSTGGGRFITQELKVRIDKIRKQ